jgi:alpha-galactosidase
MEIKLRSWVFAGLILAGNLCLAQSVQKLKDRIVLTNNNMSISVSKQTGLVSYKFSNGMRIDNATAYVNDVHAGLFSNSDYSVHKISTAPLHDKLGTGLRVTIIHSDDRHAISLVQHFTLYKSSPYLIINAEASNRDKSNMETRDICPLAVLPGNGGKLTIAGNDPRILDAPFDNDNWVGVVQRSWAKPGAPKVSGISYDFISIYDRFTFSGLVMGSISHDFWKTGIAYRAADTKGQIDSLKIFGGASTPDHKELPAAYGGYDGTHDLVEHGTMLGQTISSPDIYLAASSDIRKTLTEYGEVNAKVNGRLSWTGAAPVYWNSFGVEGVLGSSGIMMPQGVEQVSDFLHTLKNMSSHSKPVLSIDSYDQNIYSTEVLKSLGEYAGKNNQQMGFYFIPFALWTWKDAYEGKKLQGTDYLISDVLLRDNNHQPILYKDGKFCSYAMDPTHPAIRQYIIYQLKKAKAINAKFLKIDFLTAGTLETSVRYDHSVRTGMQAYSKGMKELKFLIDSIMGKDIFITEAISPLFPSQYAHTRFNSTDVYSHLRDDEKGFPHYGSTEASLATGSHMGWVQGTIYPFNNMDVTIMKSFQQYPSLNETEIKVRIYSLMVMGSILGDGSDFRNQLAAERAKKFLDNKQISDFFSQPKTFTPLRFADGDSLDQQLSFYLPDKTLYVALFNFDMKKDFLQNFSLATFHLDKNKAYLVKDFLTGKILSEIKKGQSELKLSTGPADALMVTINPKN